MSIRKRIIEEYQKNWDAGDIKNSTIPVKTRLNLILWCDDPEHKNNGFPALVNDEPLIFGDTLEEAKAVAEKYNFEVDSFFEEGYHCIILPKDTEVLIAMNVEDDLKSGYKLERDYVSELTSFFYGDVELYMENMEEKDLEDLFYE